MIDNIFFCKNYFGSRLITFLEVDVEYQKSIRNILQARWGKNDILGI